MIRAAILAGGRSSRFGKDKALAVFKGTTLLGRSIELVRRLNMEPLLLAPKQRDYGRLFSCEVVEDDHSGEGPLGALVTLWKKKPKDTFLVLTCDMPHLTAEALLSLLLSHDADSAATLYESRERTEPFPGIYQSAPALTAWRALEPTQRSMHAFLEGVKRKKIVSWLGSQKILTNVNRPADISGDSALNRPSPSSFERDRSAGRFHRAGR